MIQEVAQKKAYTDEQTIFLLFISKIKEIKFIRRNKIQTRESSKTSTATIFRCSIHEHKPILFKALCIFAELKGLPKWLVKTSANENDRLWYLLRDKPFIHWFQKFGPYACWGTWQSPKLPPRACSRKALDDGSQ